MPKDKTESGNQQAEIQRLRLRLQESEEVLDAIRRGAVDALVVSGPDGDQVYTLTGADTAYRVLFETMNEGAAILVADGMVFFCNARLSSMLETPMEAIVGRSIHCFVPAQDVPSVDSLLKTGLEGPQKREIALKPRDGNVIPCQVSTNPLLVDGTSAICMILTDLTELKQAEEARCQSEQIFRAIFEGADDCIILKDQSLRFTQVNPAFERLFGLPASEIIGRSDAQLFGIEGSRHIMEKDLSVLKGETVEEEQSRTINGVPMRFLATKTPLREASGQVVGILTMLHDITDRKRTELIRSTMQAEYPSAAMRALLKQARTAAKGSSTVLLTGESGSGKDHVAKYIHDHSDWANGPYLSINCAAIASELAESELFGHEKGAFTGAAGRKRGLLELAQGGTLLLNEIGDLSLHLQAKLLTFLDTRKFTRVGGEKEILVSARLIAATNKDLEKAIQAGEFRKDLFYRLHVMSIALPPLRQRRDDIPVLIEEILSKIRTDMQLHEMPAIDPAVINVMKRYRWPGNVRELRNVLERAVILSGGKNIVPEHLGLNDSDQYSSRDGLPSEVVSSSGTLEELINDVIRSRCVDALRRSGGNKKSAAVSLGIARDTLYRHIEKLGIGTEDYT